MSADISHDLEFANVSYSGLLQRIHLSQIGNKIELGINHVTKEEVPLTSLQPTSK